MKNLTAAQISQGLRTGSKAKLRLNRHQKVDKRVKIKQGEVKDDLQASGKADFSGTMKKLGL